MYVQTESRSVDHNVGVWGPMPRGEVGVVGTVMVPGPVP